MADNFSTVRRWLGDDSSVLHLLCTIFLLLLHQFYLRSSGIRFWRLRTPALMSQKKERGLDKRKKIAILSFFFFQSKPGLVIYFTCDNMHVSMLFSQIIPPSPSPTESKSLFFTSVSLLLSHIQGHYYHLSKLHVYVLIYCTDVFLSDLLCSV